MTAAAHHDPDDSSFVGQILMRSSPVLTWRPALVAKLDPKLEQRAASVRDARGMKRGAMDPLVRTSPSRMPTRRMVAWPVVRRVVHHSRAEHVKQIAKRALTAIVLGSALGLLVLVAIRPILTERMSRESARALSARLDAVTPSLPAPAGTSVTVSSTRDTPAVPRTLVEPFDTLSPSTGSTSSPFVIPVRAAPSRSIAPASARPAPATTRPAHARRPLRRAHR